MREDALQPKAESNKRRAALPILPPEQPPNVAPAVPTYWRNPEEMVDEESYGLPDREFPPQADEPPDAVSRRHFLHLMSASFALAGLTACTQQPTETIVPYVKPPEGIVLGKSQYYATAMPVAGAAIGLLVESREGRPTKIEGNPDHPASLGATDTYAQASLLTLYDPDRSQTITYLGEISTWEAFQREAGAALESQRAAQGAGLRFLTETVYSPTLAAQLREFLRQFPAAKWHQYEPVHHDHAIEGGQIAWGEPTMPIYRFENADVVLAIDADFLSCGAANLRYARDFALRRKATNAMNRLYALESSPTNTGAVADHRLPIHPNEIENVVRALAAGVGVTGVTPTNDANKDRADWTAALLRDLQAHRGRSIVLAGDEQSPAVHAFVHAINQSLGNIGQTVLLLDPVEANPIAQMQSLRELVADMDAGRVEMLVIFGGNPVHSAPADLNFADRMNKVRLRVHQSLYNDETSELCHWHIPESHYLESWGDTRAYDGTASIIQPLIQPLYQSKSAHELLAALLNAPARNGYDIVREYWKANYRNPANRTPYSIPTGQNQPASATPAPAPTTSNAVPPAATASTSSQTTTTTASPTTTVAIAAGSPATTSATTATSSDEFEQFWRQSLHDGFLAIPHTGID